MKIRKVLSVRQVVLCLCRLFFGSFKKTQARKNSRIPKKLKQISQKLKNRPTLMTEYHLIFGQFIGKSTCLTVIGFFAVESNYLTTNYKFCSAFVYKNSTLIPKSFVKHQKLKENHKKLKHFPKKLKEKLKKLKNPPTRVEMGWQNLAKKDCFPSNTCLLIETS